MIKGSRIEIHNPIETGTDTFNIPTTKWGLEAVLGDVLVAPASTQDVEGTIRPNGDEITMDFYIPKTYTASLRGRQIHHQGNIYEVIGDPQPYPEENTPTRWNRVVHARKIEG
jgi:hypothetical protein